jgi:hypothetical protein
MEASAGDVASTPVPPLLLDEEPSDGAPPLDEDPSDGAPSLGADPDSAPSVDERASPPVVPSTDIEIPSKAPSNWAAPSGVAESEFAVASVPDCCAFSFEAPPPEQAASQSRTNEARDPAPERIGRHPFCSPALRRVDPA